MCFFLTILYFCVTRCMLWRRCCRGLSVWSRVLLVLARLSRLLLLSTTCPDRAMGKIVFKYLIILSILFLPILKDDPLTFRCLFPAAQCWCVLPVTSLWISWLRRLTRLGLRLSDFAPRVVKPSSPQCHFWLFTIRSATWTGQSYEEK